MSDTREWPTDLVGYRRTPDFTENTIPDGLRKTHSTKQGVWANIHVVEGLLHFRDHETETEFDLGPGIHPVIYPEALHDVAPVGTVKFFVEFLKRGT